MLFNETTLAQEFDFLEKNKVIDKTLPESILPNLNPTMELRPYQVSAIARLRHYLESYESRSYPAQLLFQMATGSGKTLVMATSILYLYGQGYRNFIFFVNSDTIIKKTKNNFLEKTSLKYLFNQAISIRNQRINITEVENFEGTNFEDINILFSTIQALHIRLNAPRENQLTYDDFAEKKIVLISDEAHHINTQTKKDKTEAFLETSWETTVNRIFHSNSENILLEFTATLELSNKNIDAKYRDKLLFNYDLARFRQDGYSKDVNTFQSHLPVIDRAIQSIILSQYRKKVFEQYASQIGKTIKPVVLMKSKSIAESKQFEQDFHHALRNLTTETLVRIKGNKSDTKALTQAFDYLESQQIDLENFVLELQGDFNETFCISVNSKEDSEEKQLAINDLENPENPYRLIFAVDKLNEGWDVLNLFDIVRLYDTRDSKEGKVGKTTVAEAQLIGRGARYFPFQLSADQEKYKRKYDDDQTHSLRIVEELHYHCSHNPSYISEIRLALRQMGLLDDHSFEQRLVLKESFKKTPIYDKGVIFQNDKVERSSDLGDYHAPLITQEHYFQLYTGAIREDKVLDNELKLNTTQGREKYYFCPQTRNQLVFSKQVVLKAFARNMFFSFQNLKRYYPHLQTITDFLTHEDGLRNISVEVIGDDLTVKNLPPYQQLQVVEKVLATIQQEIEKNYKKYKGTTLFKAKRLSQIIHDKVLNFSNVGDKEELGRSMLHSRRQELRIDLNQEKYDWYVFTDNFGTDQEKFLIKYIGEQINHLKEKYSEIYLLRNERFFKIYHFADGRAIEPDFLLLLTEKLDNEKLVQYHIFIEPKGQQLIAGEKWKEDFLKEIETNHEVDLKYENQEFRLIGLPFFNQDQKTSFLKAFDKMI